MKSRTQKQYFYSAKRRFNYEGADRYLAIAFVWGAIIFAILAILWQFFGPQECRVYQKDYQEAHYVEGSKNSEGTKTPGYWVDERYILSIETYWNDHRVTNSFSVPEAIFNQARIGDWYNDHCVCLELEGH